MDNTTQITEETKEKNWKVSFKKYAKAFLDYVIKTMYGMAYGLFATLIISVIISTIGSIFLSANANWLIFIGEKLTSLSTALKSLMGVGIGIGIAYSLKLSGIKLISVSVAGGVATLVTKADPIVAYITIVVSAELIHLILRKATPVDIILIPLLTSIIALIIASLIGSPIASAMTAIGQFLTKATTLQPFFMGIILSVVMGICLTAPISSAALAISFHLGGLAGGAAVVGCCVQMLGFAVQGRKDNNIGLSISTAIGTSMLQFKNILKKPIIWLPTIITSAILGPLATIVFKIQCDASGAGMGTSGLVGQVATFSAMGNTSAFWIGLIVLEIILPIILVYLFDLLFRKLKWIKEGDLKI